MKKANIGDIWIVLNPKIKTNNKHNISVELEQRPCLIIDDGHGFIIEKSNDYLGLKITTQDNGIRKKEIKNWYDVGLREKSYLRIEPPIKIEVPQLIKKIGQIDKYDLYMYLNELSDYFNIEILENIKRKEA
ncbi:MAG: hypothetical protein HFJ41_03870 [Clostridia bacterium]|nr:hypothetical protein [Clostridia bacterium]